MIQPILNLLLLSIITFLPVAGAALLMLLPGQGPRTDASAKLLTLTTTLLTFAFSLVMLLHFDPARPGFQFVEQFTWMNLQSVQILYKKGVDGLSIWFVVASAFLMPLCILAAWDPVKVRVREFMAALLVLETMMIGMFSTLDFVLFYVFFEGVLLPMFLIIGVWGGKGRVFAAYKFFLYTLLGSVLMLVAIIAMCLKLGTTDMAAFFNGGLPAEWQPWLWLAFFASFSLQKPPWAGDNPVAFFPCAGGPRCVV